MQRESFAYCYHHTHEISAASVNNLIRMLADKAHDVTNDGEVYAKIMARARSAIRFTTGLTTPRRRRRRGLYFYVYETTAEKRVCRFSITRARVALVCRAETPGRAVMEHKTD